jgi:hypothetical protein
MGEYVRSKSGNGCLGCQPSGFGLFKQPTIGMGTNGGDEGEWWMDWGSGEEAQWLPSEEPTEPSGQVATATIHPLARRLLAMKRAVSPGTGVPADDKGGVMPGEAPPPQYDQPVDTGAQQPGAMTQRGDVELGAGMPGWVGPVVMGVVGLGVVGGAIWALKKFDVI